MDIDKITRQESFHTALLDECKNKLASLNHSSKKRQKPINIFQVPSKIQKIEQTYSLQGQYPHLPYFYADYFNPYIPHYYDKYSYIPFFIQTYSDSKTYHTHDEQLSVDAITRPIKYERNKKFYEELDSIFFQKDKYGFVDDYFFIISPKVIVGRNNRDGTLEKRIRNHFIKFVEFDHQGNHLYLCWGIIVDKKQIPLYNKQTTNLSIPGTQSTLFKEKGLMSPLLMNDELMEKYQSKAKRIVEVLKKEWKSDSIIDAKEIINTYIDEEEESSCE